MKIRLPLLLTSSLLALGFSSCTVVPKYNGSNSSWDKPGWNQDNRERNQEYRRGFEQAREVAADEGEAAGYQEGIRDRASYRRVDERRLERLIRTNYREDNRITPMIYSPDFQKGYDDGYRAAFERGFRRGYEAALEGRSVERSPRRFRGGAAERVPLTFDEPRYRR